MKLSKLLFAVVGATVLLGALVATASAGRLSSSTQAISATWTRMDFSGGFGTVECEVSLAGSLHTRTISKTANTLMGYITEANVNRCARGGATVLRATLPWHVTYRAFTGTLPNISAIATNVIGASFQMREPTFGVTCLARSSASSPNIGTYNREAGGRITSVTAGGEIPCSGGISVTGRIGGTSSAVSAMTVTLI